MRRCIVCFLIMLFFCACGGGGGGGGSNPGSTTNSNDSIGGNTGGTVDPGTVDPGTIPGPTQPTTATITLSTKGTLPQGTAISGVTLSISLPPGIVLATSEAGGVAGEVVSGSGWTVSKLAVTSDLIPPTETTYGTLRIVAASTDAAGFGVGEFAAVACSVAAGAYPETTDFQVADFKAFDLRGMTIGTVSPALTVLIR